MKPWTVKSIIPATIGLFLVVIGASMVFIWPHVFQLIIHTVLPLKESSRAFDMWKDSSNVPINIDFYFFNWTNPEDLGVAGKKPNLVQLGPYSFKEVRQKVNITFHPENNTVSYQQRKFWNFDADRSNGSLNDVLVQLNVVAVSAAESVKYSGEFEAQAASFILDKFGSIYVVKKVDEMLFTGYEDKIIKMGQLAQKEDMPPFDRFGWFYERNGSTFFDGHFNVATGGDDIRNLGKVKKWNYRDTTKYYKSPCNVVEGSAGEFFPPRKTKEDITIFTPDLCRPLTYEYVSTVDHRGIQGYKYSLGDKSLGNSTKRRYPHEQARYFESTTMDFFEAGHTTTATSNEQDDDPDTVDLGKCYCNGQCSPRGLMNITACRYGAPAFVSLPHFYKGDPLLRTQVNGLSPNARDHDFYVTLEPSTGIPLDVSARLQINILLRSSLVINLLKDVPTIYFPMFWFSLRAEMPENLTWDLTQLLIVPTAGYYVSIALMVHGILIILVVIAYQCSPISLCHRARVANNKKSELVYMDTAVANDENERTDRQLYPKL